MDIRQLTYFIAVAEHRSFTRAAASLHVTQPTLSKMVKLLEQELNVELLDRSQNPIVLTDAGTTILRSAKTIVRAMDAMQDELGQVLNLHRGELRLGIPPMIGGRFFPREIERYHSLYPQIHLRLIETGGKAIENDVESGELDIGFVIHPVTNAGRFDMHPILAEPLHVVVTPEHDLASRSAVPFEVLKTEPFILFREDFTLHHLIRMACVRAGFEPHVVMESSQWDFMTEMVAAGFGITLLPESVTRALDPKRLRAIPLQEPGITWRLSMIWRKDGYQSFAARAWIKLMSGGGAAHE